MQIDLIIKKIIFLKEGTFIIKCNNSNDYLSIKNNIKETLFSKEYQRELNFFELIPEKNSSEITISQVRDLKKKFLLKSIEDVPFVVFLPNILSLNLNSSNALLKITEEIPKNTIFIFCTDDVFKIIPTIKSRSKILNTDKEVHLKNLDDYLLTLKLQNKDIPEKIFEELSNPFFKKKIITDTQFFDTIKFLEKDNLHLIINLYLFILQHFMRSSFENEVFFKYLIKIHSEFLHDINESIMFNSMTSDLLAVYFYRLQSNVVKYAK